MIEYHHLLAWLLIGLIAGAVAGRIVEGRGGGAGILGDILIGLIGAFIGGVIIHAFTGSDAVSSFLGECLVALVGAVILLLVLRLAGRGRRRGVFDAFHRS